MTGKIFFRNFAIHFGEAAFGLLLNVLGNWLSNTAGGYFGWSTGAITATLITASMIGLSMYAGYKAVWSKIDNVDERHFAQAANTFISQGLIYSLVTTLYSWCSSGKSLSLENTASLIVGLSPYIQGNIEVNQLHQKVSKLYDTAHAVLTGIKEKFLAKNQPVRIHQNWLMNEMAKMSVAHGLNPVSLQHFSATKLEKWKQENPDLEIGKDNNGLLYVFSRP